MFYIICVTGKPPPEVKWWRDGRLVETFDSRGSGDTKQNQLIVRHLSRDDLHAEYTCTASNNNISQPLSAKISIEMHCEYKLYLFRSSYTMF